MTDRTPLQDFLAAAIAESGSTRDALDTQLRKKLNTTGKPLWDIERGKARRPQLGTLTAIEEVLGLPAGRLQAIVYPASRAVAADQPIARSADAGEVVQITRLDLSLPMGQGATIDDYVEGEPFEFDLAYVRSFTRTPPSRLFLGQGVGDSMFPTLNSSDLVWIDSTQNTLTQADRVWAVSINGAAAIKRLRPMKGGKVLVVSDNPAIENYEVGADEILIGGRIIRFARDL